jgi:hypothetical protein
MSNYEERIMETAAEIEALLINSINELFAEVIFPNYGKVTSDGIKLGPTWWSQKFEAQGIVMTAHAIESRVSRWRQKTMSEAESDLTRAEPNSRYGRAINTLRNQPAERKAEIARELLAQPEVAAQVVTDKQARATVNRAADDYYQRQASERADRTERKAAEDGTDKRVDALLWVNRLGEAQERYSREVNEALRHIGELPESERYWLTGATDRAESSLRATRRYLELGKSEFDAELETLLKNGGLR